MKLRNISVVIRREYLNRVSKKSFLLLTIGIPLASILIMFLIGYMVYKMKDDTKSVAVIDKSGIVMPFLKDNEAVKYADMSSADLAEVKGLIGEGNFDALLSISALDSVAMNVSAETYSLNPIGRNLISEFSGEINDAVESYRMDRSTVADLKSIMDSIHSDIEISTITIDESGKETLSDVELFNFVSLAFGMLLFIFVALFGSGVMSSVLEEKSSRIVEVMISSIKSTELMFGKILGQALVALTQFLIWGILIMLVISVSGRFVGGDVAAMSTDVEMLTAGMTAEQSMAVDHMMTSMPAGASVALATLSTIPWGKVIMVFLIYFLLGYLLYSSIFAAFGAAADSEADTQQLQAPVLVLLMAGYIIALTTNNAPDSSIVFWGSMIPFTSPIVMLARLPFGVPDWEILVSVGVLFVTFILFAYLSAKIYKAGILMFGKKPTWKDLYMWIKMK